MFSCIGRHEHVSLEHGTIGTVETRAKRLEMAGPLPRTGCFLPIFDTIVLPFKREAGDRGVGFFFEGIPEGSKIKNKIQRVTLTII